MMAKLRYAPSDRFTWSLVLCTVCIVIVSACVANRKPQEPTTDFRERLRSIDCERGSQFVDIIRSLGPIKYTSCGGQATPISDFTNVSFVFVAGDVLTLYAKPIRLKVCGSIKKGNLGLLDSVVVTRVTFGRSDGDRRYDVDTIVERRAGR